MAPPVVEEFFVFDRRANKFSAFRLFDGRVERGFRFDELVPHLQMFDNVHD
jgi:hypothetical protein